MIWRIVGVIILLIMLLGIYSAVTGEEAQDCGISQAVQCRYPK